MKAVLISIKPKWCELIASGKKTVEVRKTRPKLETPFKVYIYCTQGAFADLGVIGNEIYQKRCKVIGEFVCRQIHETGWYLSPDHPQWQDRFDDESCLTDRELYDYSKGGTFYGWHISDLVVYEKPRELNSFCRNGECSRCGWIEDGRCLKRDEQNCYNKHRVKRPPQSWAYVEEVGR